MLETSGGEGADGSPQPLSVDLVLCCLAVALMALAVLALPGSPLRAVLVAPALLLVPGYLLLQALFPVRAERPRHLLLSLGVSPPLVALLALATALVPGGFREGTILATVAAGSLMLAALAWTRRRTRAAQKGRGPEPTTAVPAPAPNQERVWQRL